MDDDALLQALKTDLGLTSSRYDQRLADRIAEAKKRLQAEGITLTQNIDDCDLILMYAAWLWRSRVTGEGMPRMLVIARNNRLYGQKARPAT